jgi:hypothetical protein
LGDGSQAFAYYVGTGEDAGATMTVTYTVDENGQYAATAYNVFRSEAADAAGDAIGQAAGTDNPNPEDSSGGAGSSDPRPGLVQAITKEIPRRILTMTFEESTAGKQVVRIIPALDPVYIPSPTGDDDRPERDALGGMGGGPRPEAVDEEEVAKILEYLAKNAEDLIDPDGGSVRDQLANLIGNVEGGIELVIPNEPGTGPEDPEDGRKPEKKPEHDPKDRELLEPFGDLPGPPELVNPDPTATNMSTGEAAGLDAQMGALPELLLTAPGSSAPKGIEAGAGQTAPQQATTVTVTGVDNPTANTAPTDSPAPATNATVTLGQPRTAIVPRTTNQNLKETLK